MPLYEYRCESCQNVVEALQKFSDDPLTVCTKCGGRLERLISPAGLHFKGSGWYITDYARASSGTAAPNGGKSETADTKSESKPEKSESKAEKPVTTAPKSDKS